MKIYIGGDDIGNTISYKEENIGKQHLYVHDYEGFIFKSLDDYVDEQLKLKTKEICDNIRKQVTPHTGMFYHKGQKTISISRLDKILTKIEKGEL